VDHICWRGVDGCYHAGGCHVPPLATHYKTGSVVLEHRMSGLGRTVLCYRDCAAHILYCDSFGRKSWDMDIPEVVRRRWICESRIPPRVVLISLTLLSLTAGGIIYPTLGMGPPEKENQKTQGQRTQVELSKHGETICKWCLHRGS
jgi:hypothetical protein